MKVVKKMITDLLDSNLKSIKEVTIVGYYGANNLGDDLMLESIIRELKNYPIRINVIAFGDVHWLDSSINLFKWRKKDRLGNVKILLKAIKNSDILLWGGGTCFTDEDGDGMFIPMLIAKFFRKKIFYIGVGIGNLKRKSRRIKTIILINLSNYLSFRDHNSYSKAKRWCYFNKDKIERIEDPANYVLRDICANWSDQDSEESGLVVAWRNLENYKETTIGNSLDKLIPYIVEMSRKYRCKKITLIDVDSSYDGDINREIYCQLKKCQLDIPIDYNKSQSYIDKLKVIREAKVILTSRLHVAVVSKFYNKPCYVYNYSPKIKFFVDEESDGDIHLLNEF